MSKPLDSSFLAALYAELGSKPVVVPINPLAQVPEPETEDEND